jgi:2-dehydro-3-deoxy-D-arabinonate dehydratase
VSGTGQALRIRKDATWNVPEPELTLVISPDQKLVGFTIGNDMSSRDIEGDNPLYLPQAKCYNQCCGLGPWITLIDDMPDRNSITIELKILREGNLVYTGNTSVAEMARTFEDLIGWLCRDNSFPNGAFLLTGTGIVPDSPFTLQANDQVDITIAGIGTLTNTVVQG